MSAPNADKPGEGIVGQTVNSVKNAANYVSESIQGSGKEASAKANKEVAKGNTDAGIGDRASAAGSFLGDKVDQKKHEGAADANKHSI